MGFDTGPLIAQPDRTVLLEVNSPEADATRAALVPFAELGRAPEHVHTYRITPLALQGARAAGHDAEQVVDVPRCFSRFPVPQPLLIDVAETMNRYGRLSLTKHPAHGLILVSHDPAVLAGVTRHKKIRPAFGEQIDVDTWTVHPSERGRIKQELLKVDWPASDTARYIDGETRVIAWQDQGTGGHNTWELHDYQRMAADSFREGDSGVVMLPCGADKTIVDAAVMIDAQRTALTLVANTVAGRQWRDELLRRTSLTEDKIGEHSGEKKEIRPVTIAAHQVVTRETKGEYHALELFDSRDWGLIIYDEVHLLSAPVFRMSADLQSCRRLGLTATLVHEDGHESDVFSLTGPKRYDAPQKNIEAQGWIASADCVEVRVTPTESERTLYATAGASDKYRLAVATPTKIPVVKQIFTRHEDEPALAIGAYLDQLEEIDEELGIDVIERKTSNAKREELFGRFRRGEINTLVISKIANFPIDLPEASVAVQVSGTFGSRQEEAQRLGRLSRPKSDGGDAVFYSVVARDTLDTEYAAHRQRFLTGQGYTYRIVDADEYLGPTLPGDSAVSSESQKTG